MDAKWRVRPTEDIKVHNLMRDGRLPTASIETRLSGCA
jgi:hypothetical protein